MYVTIALFDTNSPKVGVLILGCSKEVPTKLKLIQHVAQQPQEILDAVGVSTGLETFDMRSPILDGDMLNWLTDQGVVDPEEIVDSLIKKIAAMHVASVVKDILGG